jgi:phospholipid/cholesterol/gamma-HCH transport system permease protein
MTKPIDLRDLSDADLEAELARRRGAADEAAGGYAVEVALEDEAHVWVARRLDAYFSRHEAVQTTAWQACPTCGRRCRVRRKWVARTVRSLHGRHTVRRHYHYCATCQTGWYPLDAALGWPAEGDVTARVEEVVLDLGAVFTLFVDVVSSLVRPPSEIRNIVKQMEEVGIRSMPVVLVTATFTGMVLALQSYAGFQRFGATSFVGSVVALSITRELGPVFAGLMVSGRVGASMAAELGTMKVTEQIDALVTLATNPVKYLVMPRVVAATIVLPVLVVFADLLGIVGGYFVSVHLMGANPYVYMSKTYQYLGLGHLHGLIKAAVFELIALISCHHGFVAEGGAEGVGRATTRAVVASSMMVLISDYFMTSFMF